MVGVVPLARGKWRKEGKGAACKRANRLTMHLGCTDGGGNGRWKDLVGSFFLISKC